MAKGQFHFLQIRKKTGVKSIVWISPYYIIHPQDTDYLGIGLENGFLKLVSSFRRNSTRELLSDHHPPSRLTSRLVPHAGFLADGEWHTVVVRLDPANVSLVVDGDLAFVEEPGVGEMEYDDVDVFIGKTSM